MTPKEATGRLFEAVKIGDAVDARAAIAAGARVNARDKFGQVPLHIAALRGYDEIAAVLIGAGTRLNARDLSGNTPLDYASVKDHASIVTLLSRAQEIQEQSEP